MIQLKKKKIMIFTLLAMCIIMTNTAHAVPIDNFNVIENITGNIIGGNNNSLIVEYDSEDIDIVYKFQITSPYPYLNNTPEIRYIQLAVDETGIPCTNETTQNDTVFAMYCNHHLTANHHNTTISFRFAPNIIPGNYDFEFEIIHSTDPIIPFIYQSSGSSSRPRYVNNTIICNVTVDREWITPLEMIPDDEEHEDTNESEQDDGRIDDKTPEDVINGTITPLPSDDTNNTLWFIFIVLLWIIIALRLCYMRKRAKEKLSE